MAKPKAKPTPLGNRIKALRLQRNIDPKDLANQLGLSRQCIDYLESGSRISPLLDQPFLYSIIKRKCIR
ncbi:helix-turn-helix transcriptional regulator [Brevibacillus centrosporus]|uniref:helix-turn-helix transcriptional regulator n=1 Tax=Brevibacillus centrosporus TaxID=54910 RepID=UPI000F09B761|nr:helix-turn-helix transcriptional regulator [Brevibacillus centrosporus]MEC2130514.1 helix-turn-helix transcriptional regulator [Brevibacillus centrosporus]RNB68883.1 XRE family transcriptional regulator [Brevibacillus centrosporus]